jgi:hypothetical protein
LAARAVLDEQMARMVVGKPVCDTGLLQEQLYRASLFYGGAG